MDRLLLLLILGGAGYIAWRRGAFVRLGISPPIPAPPHLTTPSTSSFQFVLPPLIANLLPNMNPPPEPASTGYQPPAQALLYLSAIRTAEAANGLPRDLLVRLLDQESRYRADIIEGRVSSRVGARGIAQVMPLTAQDPGYGVPPLPNPLDPWASIAWAGRYLAALYRRFGSWSKALAAYNFGPGNVLAGKPWPTETQNYVAQITRDVAVA